MIKTKFRYYFPSYFVVILLIGTVNSAFSQQRSQNGIDSLTYARLNSAIVANFICFTSYHYINSIPPKSRSDISKDHILFGIVPGFGFFHYFNIRKSDNSFIDTSYVLYEYDGLGLEIMENDCNEPEMLRRKSYYYSPSENRYRTNMRLASRGMIAYRPRDKYPYDVLFLSGNLFLDELGEFYPSSISKPQIIDYINIRYFNYSPVKIRLSNSHKRAYFYSEVLREEIKIKLRPLVK